MNCKWQKQTIGLNAERYVHSRKAKLQIVYNYKLSVRTVGQAYIIQLVQ